MKKHKVNLKLKCIALLTCLQVLTSSSFHQKGMRDIKETILIVKNNLPMIVLAKFKIRQFDFSNKKYQGNNRT
jgi:hypothetical protein